MDLGQYFKRVLRWWWLILLTTVIAGSISYYVSSKRPRIYQTTTTLIVGQVLQTSNPSGQDFVLAEQLAESYAQIALRQPILQAAIDRLGLDIGWQGLKWQVNVYAIPRTQLLGITVEDSSPERAVAIADEIAFQLILQSPNSPQNKNREERSGFVRSRLDSLESRIQDSEVRMEDLEAELDISFSARDIQELQTEIGSLDSQINDWQTNYAELLQFLEGGDSPNYLTVIEPAQLPRNPISPKVQINVILASIAGFILAIGGALAIEYIDDTIKSRRDLDLASGLTSLGSILEIKGSDYKDKLITADARNAFLPEVEAYRQIRTNLQFMAIDDPAQTIMLTSAKPGEGKSTTVANLGVMMAQADLRTIIVDGDLRKPTIHKVFQVSNIGGLTDLIYSQEFEIKDYLKETGVENLQVITSGPLPPNSSEMLGSKRMSKVIEELRNIADVIIFDSPPVLVVTDAIVLSKQVDGVLFVTRSKYTRRGAVKEAVERLKQVRANVLGSILNAATSRGKTGYGYYAYYSHSGYGAPKQAKASSKRSWWKRLPVLNSD